MLYSIYSEDAAIILDTAESLGVKKIVDDFQSSQLSNFGILSKPLIESNFNIVDQFEKIDPRNIYLYNSIFRHGSSIIMSEYNYNVFKSLCLPKHQVFTGLKNKEIILIYFNFDYFKFLNFDKCKFSVYRKDYEDRDGITVFLGNKLISEVNFRSHSEYQEWEIVNSKLSIRQSIKFEYLEFQEEVYQFDLIPSIKLDHRLIVSDAFIDSFNNNGLEVYNCLLPIQII